MPDAHVVDDLGAYALGALDLEDRKAADRHLADCASCREAAAEYRKLASELHDGVHLETPPGGTWDAIAAALPRQRPAPIPLQPSSLTRVPRDRRFRIFAIGWAATAAALVAVVAVIAWQNTGSTSNPTVAQLASSGDSSVIPLAGANTAATGRFYVSAEKSLGGLAVTGLPSSATGQTYEVWFVGKDQQWTWAGSVAVNAGGDGLAQVKLPASLANFAGVAICTEAASDSPTQWGQMVLSGPFYE